MSHGYNNRAKDLESTVNQETLPKLQENIINNTSNLKDELFNLKDTVIKNSSRKKSETPHYV